MEITRLDGSAPEALRAGWHELEVAVAAEPGWPEPPLPRSLTDAWLDLPGVPGEEGFTQVWAAHQASALDASALKGAAAGGGAVEGVAVAHPHWGENAHSVDVRIVVHPRARRRGVGRALLTTVAASARAALHQLVEGGAPRGSAGERFLESAGVTGRLVERQSSLRVADLDRELLTEPANPRTGYRLEAWAGVPGPGLLAGVAAARESMDDAPKGGLHWARQTYRPDSLARTYELHRARGVAVLGTAAVHEASGDLVGYTELQRLSPGDATAHQAETVVVPAHRGHRLGLALKAANLVQLLDTWRGIERVLTWNAEANGHMLAVNTELGFRPDTHWVLAEVPV